MPEPLAPALAQLRGLLLDPEGLVRAVAAGRRRGTSPQWRRAELRPVDLAAGPRLQVVTYDTTQAHTRNERYGETAEAAVDALLAEPFANWHVQTAGGTVQLRVTKKGEAQVHRAAGAGAPEGRPHADTSRAHDRAKPRLLDPAHPALRALGISDAGGRIRPSRQAKYRQVEELLRALDAVVETAADPATAAGRPLRVVDLGCGNAYLTLAAYAFLTDRLGAGVELVGVDVKEQARAHGAETAAGLGWSDRVRFVVGSALDAPVDDADVVLALHACDTATDEALARAVRMRAPVVLAAPCCHHDIQRQLAAAGTAPEPYALLTRHGILRERFADVLTDALRAALLRLHGYRVDVIEFVGSEHTPRNTLLRAVFTGAAPTPEQQREYDELTRTWGVRPHLATLLDGDPPGTVTPASAAVPGPEPAAPPEPLPTAG